MTQVRWNGDFANEPKTGSIVSRTNGNVTIQWDNGKREVVPEGLIARQGWSLK